MIYRIEIPFLAVLEILLMHLLNTQPPNWCFILAINQAHNTFYGVGPLVRVGFLLRAHRGDVE